MQTFNILFFSLSFGHDGIKQSFPTYKGFRQSSIGVVLTLFFPVYSVDLGGENKPCKPYFLQLVCFSPLMLCVSTSGPCLCTTHA